MTMEDVEVPRRRRRAKRRVIMGEINIVSQPHSVDTYIEAIKALCDQKVQVTYHGQRYIEIGSYRDLDDIRIPNAVAGRLFVFSKFNFDDPWLNTARNAQATDDDLKQVNVPAHLVPEFRHFRFIFDVRKHKFYFEKYSEIKGHLSSKAFTRALNQMFRSGALAGKFEEINAFAVADDEAVESILGLHKLRKLFIQVHRPNPDDDDFDQTVLDELNAQNIGVREETLIKAPGVESIIPGEITKKLARLGSRLGIVIGWGKNPENNQPIDMSTEEHPKDHIVLFGEGEDSFEKMVDYIKDKNDTETDGPHIEGDA